MTNTKTNQSSGLRYNQGKPRHDLVSWPAINELAKVLTAGAQKYADRNWEKGLSYSDTFASLQRHLQAWWNGEENDSETGLPHMAHVLCNAMFLQHFALTNSGTDDRPKYKKETSVEEKMIERIKEWNEYQERVERLHAKAGAYARAAAPTDQTIGSRVEQGYSGFLSDHDKDAVVHSGLLDLQAHVQPKAIQRGSLYRGDGGMEGYGEPSNYSNGFGSERWLQRRREEALSYLSAATEGNCGRTLPLAAWHGYGESAGFTEPTELRVHDDQRVSKAVHVGDGCSDAGQRCRCKSPA